MIDRTYTTWCRSGRNAGAGHIPFRQLLPEAAAIIRSQGDVSAARPSRHLRIPRAQRPSRQRRAGDAGVSDSFVTPRAFVTKRKRIVTEAMIEADPTHS